MAFNSKLVKQKRIEMGYSQEQLAEKLHTTHSTISKWENGYRIPDQDQMRQIGLILQIQEEDLRSEENQSSQSMPANAEERQTAPSEKDDQGVHIKKYLELYLVFIILLIISLTDPALGWIFACINVFYVFKKKMSRWILAVTCIIMAVSIITGMEYWGIFLIKPIIEIK